jgi:branched chain amino acid efflux pump
MRPVPSARYRDGVRAVLPLLIPSFTFGISFGILARSTGLGILEPLIMSATTFGGSAQFAAISILAVGGAVPAAITAAVLLQARYLPMGIATAPSLTGGNVTRFLQAQMVVDESWAVAAREGGRFDRHVLVGAGMALYASWVGGTAIGLLGGRVFGDPRQLGLDAAFPALFLALLVPRLRNRLSATGAVLGGLVALAAIPFTPPGVPIVAAGGVCLLGWRQR